MLAIPARRVLTSKFIENGRYSVGKYRITNQLTLAGLNLEQGFGVTARSTAEAKRLEPTGILVFRQADVGEYLREVQKKISPIVMGFAD